VLKHLSSKPSARAAFLEGVKTMLPLVLPFAAYAFVTGMAMTKVLSPAAAIAMTMLVYAASAQLAALPLIAAHLPMWTIFFSAISVNLRFTIFSAAMQPRFGTLPFWRRLVLGYLNGDVAYVLFSKRYSAQQPTTTENSAEHEGYFFGVALCNWFFWQIASICGVLFGQQIPASWDIGFAGTLALLAITIPLLVDAAGVLAMLAAAAACLVGLDWPYRLNIVAAVFAATIVGVTIDHYFPHRTGMKNKIDNDTNIGNK